MKPTRYGLTLALTFFVLGQAQSPRVTLNVTANVQATYRQGETADIDFVITLSDAAETVDEGVLFLNVVERDAARGWPQAAHLVFATAQEKESVFRVPYSGRALREGVSMGLSFKLREQAKPGDYALVIQLYRGRETNPNRVRVADRIALRGFDFSVVAP